MRCVHSRCSRYPSCSASEQAKDFWCPFLPRYRKFSPRHGLAYRYRRLVASVTRVVSVASVRGPVRRARDGTGGIADMGRNHFTAAVIAAVLHALLNSIQRYS